MKTEEIVALLQPIADAIGVAASELWKLYYREYLVKGVVQIFIGLFFVMLYFTLNLPLANWIFIRLVLLPFVVYFIASGIRYALNPGFYAVENLMDKLQTVKQSRRGW